tara:strand:- start:128 stop:1309 length:1182 start_codon:yes stop_codon:yes gene_type:complete
VTKQLKVDSVVNVAGTGKPNFPVSPTSGGAALSTLNTHSYTSSATEPSSPKNGAIWWDSANSKVYIYANGEFKEVTLNTDYPSAYIPAPSYLGPRGFMLGGNGSTTNMSYIDITTAGDAQDFGDMIGKFSLFSGVGNGARIVTMGGYNNQLSGTKQTNEIQYFASATTGNASDFGDLTQARDKTATVGDATRAVCGGGGFSGAQNVMDYITIANTGNATDFGDLTVARLYHGATNDATRGVYISGENGGYRNTMDYITTQTAGNATDFGDVTNAVYGQHSGICADATRGLYMGGIPQGVSYALNSIEYITIQTTGNGTDFGDMNNGRSNVQACSDGTTGIIMGGFSYPTNSGTAEHIQKVTIQTLGNATDYGGDLLSSSNHNQSGAGASGAAS